MPPGVAMTISTHHIADLMRPGLNEFFANSFKEIPEEWAHVFNNTDADVTMSMDTIEPVAVADIAVPIAVGVAIVVAAAVVENKPTTRRGLLRFWDNTA